MKEPKWVITYRLPPEQVRKLPPGNHVITIEEIHQAFNEKGEPEVRVYGKLVEEKK